MRRSFLALTLLLLLCVPAFGLSDAEYRRLKRTNSDFRRADTELSQVWTRLKGSLSSKVFEELQKNQREWIRKGRDDAARKYIREGYSRVEAYTMATNDRTEALPGIANRLGGKSATSATSQTSKPKPKLNQLKQNKLISQSSILSLFHSKDQLNGICMSLNKSSKPEILAISEQDL